MKNMKNIKSETFNFPKLRKLKIYIETASNFLYLI